MRLTCITAVYNAIASGNRDNLIRCVQSVAKIGTGHEHLIYDGGSSDGTVNLLRELERTTLGLKVVVERDTGIYNALNKGVRDASGAWFYVLGCDDYISHPDILDSLLQDQKVEGNAELVISPVERTSGRIFFTRIWDLRKIFMQFPYSHQGVLMKTEIVRACGGFDEKYQICADWDMQMKCHLDARRFCYKFKPFAYYADGGISERMDTGDQGRIHANSLNVSEDELSRLWTRGYLPYRIFCRFFSHPDLAIRLGAWGLLLKLFRYYIRMAFFPLVVITRPIRYKILRRCGRKGVNFNFTIRHNAR